MCTQVRVLGSQVGPVEVFATSQQHLLLYLPIPLAELACELPFHCRHLVARAPLGPLWWVEGRTANLLVNSLRDNCHISTGVNLKQSGLPIQGQSPSPGTAWIGSSFGQTEWCAGMVVVPKPNNMVRICVDLTHLNKSVCRERHPLPAVKQTLAQLAGARVFSKLNVNSDFWQIPLSQESAWLTTFITPFGRYCFHCLPFGITSAPAHFQRCMSDLLSDLLSDLDRVVCMIDDVLVHGRTVEEHDKHLVGVLHRLEQVELILNQKKCRFSQSQVKFLGQVVDQSGIHPDPKKIRAIQSVRPPSNVGDVQRFLRMVNHLSKFSPNLAEELKPLRELLVKQNDWVRGDPQIQAF